jgi:exopolysaccharide biosynthesis polyprenyl glycosylphosphotransferase
MLACADLAAALLATMALAIIGEGDSSQFAWALVWIPCWVVIAKLLGLYDGDERALRHLTSDEIAPLVLWAVLGTAFLSLALGFTPAGRPEASSAMLAAAVAAFSAFSLRALTRLLWRTGTPPERIALIGPAHTTDAFRRKLELFPDLHMAIVEHRNSLPPDEQGSEAWLQTIERIVYAPAALDEEDVRELLDLSRERGLLLSVVPPWRGIFGASVQINHVAELPILAYKKDDLPRSSLFLKRGLDVAVSAFALVALMPFFLLISMAVKLDSHGPVLFSQVRAGYRGRPFRLLKFRSMVENAEELLPNLVPFEELDEPMFKLHKDPRVTRVGRILRRWSIDELPQLWNVLIGQMSLVGPRPEQLELVGRYAPGQRFRLAVRPGLTGPMQVYGRGQLTFAERLAVERDYVDNLSILTDARIIAMTIGCVFHGRGAY